MTACPGAVRQRHGLPRSSETEVQRHLLVQALLDADVGPERRRWHWATAESTVSSVSNRTTHSAPSLLALAWSRRPCLSGRCTRMPRASASWGRPQAQSLVQSGCGTVPAFGSIQLGAPSSWISSARGVGRAPGGRLAPGARRICEVLRQFWTLLDRQRRQLRCRLSIQRSEQLKLPCHAHVDHHRHHPLLRPRAGCRLRWRRLVRGSRRVNGLAVGEGVSSMAQFPFIAGS